MVKKQWILALGVTAVLSGIAVPVLAQAQGLGGRADLTQEDRIRVLKVTAPTTDFSVAEPFELMQGGAGTVSKLVNADIFSQPAANLDFEGRQAFMVGNGLFRKDWVSSPSSTLASDGLGPLFNARSCQACHVKDGRGTVPGLDPADKSEAMALLIRFGLPDGSADPVYGRQFQPFAVPGLAGEGRLQIDYTDVPVTLAGGETVTLKKPAVRLTQMGYGALHPDAQLSVRIAPPMLGLGLLEAIHPDDIVRNIETPAAHRDGISGRVNWLVDPVSGRQVPGRFGWKAGQVDVKHQSAEAFSMDMGLSTPLNPDPLGDCTDVQGACRTMPTGVQPVLGEHEVPGDLIDFVTTYSSNLALPRRRDVDAPEVLAGKRLFYESN
ncbi:MAG: di-heme oxidoredictase family protein, partial [Pusillimonas sp.]